MTAYYNEIDPYAAAWLRNLIAAGHIADGVVDERSIEDVCPADLRGFTQCHFFAGIGVWSHALRTAGWSDDRPVWTGSCPCQPFSAAGKGSGTADERHLWPAWHHLIRELAPAVVFGEQVEAAIAHGWLDLVQADLEDEGYAVGIAGLPAAGVGAPHIRQRLWFVANATRQQHARSAEGAQSARRPMPGIGRLGRVADTGRERQQQHAQRDSQPLRGIEAPRRDDAGGRGELGHTDREHEDSIGGLRGGEGTECDRGSFGLANPKQHDRGREAATADHGAPQADRPTDWSGGRGGAPGFWSAADWIDCRDGRRRPVEPGTFPLAHGAAARVGRLRAYGNAIVAPLAARFIEACMTLDPVVKAEAAA